MALTKAFPRMIAGSIINVKDYGAVGDGVTDDTAAIQLALDAQESVLFEPNKTYLVSATLNIKGNTSVIDGCGASFTCPQPRITTLFSIEDLSNVVIKNVNWNPPAYNSTGSQQARMVFYKNSNNIAIDNCEVTDGALLTSGQTGLGQARSTNISITNCRAIGDYSGTQNTSSGITIGATQQTFIENCYIKGYSIDGIKFTTELVEDSSSVTFTTASSSAYVTVAHSSHGLFVGDRINLGSSVSVGGLTLSGQYVVIEVVNVNSYKIIADAEASSAATSSSSTITGYVPLTERISVKRCIFKNIASGPDDSGIDIYSKGRNTVISENIFENVFNGVMFKNEDSDDGLSIVGDVYNSVISDNKFLGCELGIFVRYAENLKILRNYFEYGGVTSAGAKDNRDIFVRGPIKGFVIQHNTHKHIGENAVRFDIASHTLSGVDDIIDGVLCDNEYYDSECPNVVFVASTSGKTPEVRLDISNNKFNNCSCTDVVGLRMFGDGLCTLKNNTFVDCTASNSAIRFIAATTSDKVIANNNNYFNLTGTEFSTVSTISIVDDISSIGCSIDGTTNTRFSSVISSDECELNSIQQVILCSVKTKTSGTNKIVTGYSASGSASTANRTTEIAVTTGDVTIAGTLTQSHTFTDFAEMMPNGTGAEIPAGTILTMHNGKVVPASDGDDICGVVSHTAAVLAGDTPFCWQGRYLVDEFGRREMVDIIDQDTGETITVPKENPLWDSSQDQIPRSDRPDQWTPVGLVGQVFVRVDASISAGDKVKASNGIGTKSDTKTGLMCMKITKPYDGNYGIAKCLINISV